jgi:hypothetical protein
VSLSRRYGHSRYHQQDFPHSPLLSSRRRHCWQLRHWNLPFPKSSCRVLCQASRHCRRRWDRFLNCLSPLRCRVPKVPHSRLDCRRRPSLHLASLWRFRPRQRGRSLRHRRLFRRRQLRLRHYKRDREDYAASERMIPSRLGSVGGRKGLWSDPGPIEPIELDRSGSDI